MKTNILSLLIIIVLATSIKIFSQPPKQGNTVNAEIYADAPYRMKISNSNGSLNPIPIHIFAHDADGIGANIELISIDIYIKNASDTTFTDLITFDDYSQQQFENILLHRSPYNPILDVQDFNSSGYQRSSQHTIIFTETHDNLDGEDYVEIKQKFWYFTIMIPPDKLAGYDSIIDFKVYFNIDWSVDDETYLRVFRYATDLPHITNWYRGDTHYHTIFTQNVAETGEAIEATHLMGKYVGLDWQFTSDHSCDFDNYGISMSDNWQQLGNQIYQQNILDTSYIMIRGIEMSVNNNNGKVVHALAYPSPDAPFSLPYIGDGGGDYSSTSVNVDMMLDSLSKYEGICYAAHPFAEGDKLPVFVNGGVWNINDLDFPENGVAHPSNGTIICNDLTAPSDVFSSDTSFLFKKSLYGFQIWNLYNSLITTDEDNFSNPYNVEYDPSLSSLQYYPETEPNNFMYRFWQGMDVMKFFFRKGLTEKNSRPWIKHWKVFLLAGSDAHGSFNYSTTDMYYANYGTIEDNAIGRLNTLVYLPHGKGEQGKNILKALQQGHSVISDGPIVTMDIRSSYSNSIIALPGDDTTFNYSDLQNNEIAFQTATTYEYGNIVSVKLIIGTEEGEYSIPLNIQQNSTTTFNLQDFLNNIFIQNIPTDEYFYLRVELITQKDYGNKAYIYKKEKEKFYSFTNPIWLKVTNIITNTNNENINNNIEIYNTYNSLTISYKSKDKLKSLCLYNALGQCIKQTRNNTMVINKNDYPNGLYMVKAYTLSTRTMVKKIIIN